MDNTGIIIIIIVIIIMIILALLYLFTDIFQFIKDKSTSNLDSVNYITMRISDYSNDVITIKFYHQIQKRINTTNVMKINYQIKAGLLDLLGDGVITQLQYDTAYAIAKSNGWI